MDAIRVGVIGTGRMGRNHCRVLTTLRHAELVGICESNVQAGVAAARQYETAYFASLDELLGEVQAVTVAVPTPYHFEIASRCLERGVHLFLEKPITQTVADADALVALAEQSGLVVQIGHIERFNPAYAELKNVIEEMTPLAINFRRLSPYAGSNRDVDVVLDLMIHDCDLLLDLAGRSPQQLHAAGISAYSGSLDHVSASLRAASGPLVTVTASRLTEQKVREIEVTSLEAYVVADLLHKTIAVHRSMVGEYLPHSVRSVKYRQEAVVQSIQVPAAEPLFLELQHFVDCVKNGATPLVTAAHGAQALRLATSIQKRASEEALSLATVRRLQPVAIPFFAEAA